MQNKTKLLIEFSPLFDRRLKQLPHEIITAFNESIDLFLDMPNNERLRRHFLKGKYAGYESIDITDDYRAIFKEIKAEAQVIIKFHIIGTRDQLYK